MTNRTRRTCSSCDKPLTASNKVSEYEALCLRCYTMSGLENSHEDGWHEDGDEMDDCPLCNPDLVWGEDAPRKAGHHNTAAHTRGSHAACYAADLHAKTPEARAACRKTRA